MLWHIGEDIPFVPNKRRGGVIIGGVIAPIFFNTAQDSGALPIKADVEPAARPGDVIVIDTEKGEVRTEGGEVLSTFQLEPATLRDEFRAGGRIPLIIGRALTDRARKALGLPPADLFTLPATRSRSRGAGLHPGAEDGGARLRRRRRAAGRPPASRG